MKSERLQQIKDVDAKRTQGEITSVWCGNEECWKLITRDARCDHDGDGVSQWVASIYEPEDAMFYALASTAIPELVAEVERLTDEANDTVREKDERIELLECEWEQKAQQVRDLEAENARLRKAMEAICSRDTYTRECSLEASLCDQIAVAEAQAFIECADIARAALAPQEQP